MSSDTLAKFPVAPDIPEQADALRIVPQRRFGQWAAAVLVLVLLGLAVNSVLRNKALQWDVVADPVLRFGVKTVDLLGPVDVAVVGLTLYEAAYAADVVRGGILSVDRGQIEAARALGLSRWRRRIVLPQAMRSIVPPAGNMLICTLKGTSIVSVIAVTDPLFSAQLIYHRTYQFIPLLMAATLWYTVVTSVLAVGRHYVEKHYARGSERAR